MDAKATFHSQYPNAIFLEHQLNDKMVDYFRQRSWVDEDESVIAIDKPGEGNMNFVARVTTERRSFIVKQALPWVYKYPQVSAPITRGKMEAIFYQLIEDDSVLQQYTPSLIGFDSQSHVLAQEDLGAGADFTFLYRATEPMTIAQRDDLLLFLSHLHQIQTEPTKVSSLENSAMRELNHEHIFQYPFSKDNGLDLDTVLPGLRSVALSYQQDNALRRRVAELGEVYLQNGDTLLHGDFYPGSWLRVASGIKVIDPEFGFFGRPEFDVGVMVAHALITDTEVYSPEQVLANYRAPNNFDESLARAFAGTEVMRRLLGLAQLPLPHTLSQREALLQQAAAML